jgi:hypothetical protein
LYKCRSLTVSDHAALHCVCFFVAVIYDALPMTDYPMLNEEAISE